MQVPIDAQLKLNTQEASQAIQDLNKTMVLGPGGGPQGILGAGGPLNQISPLSPQSFQMYNNLNMNMRTFTDQLTKVIEKFKVFEKSLEEANTNGGGAGGGFAGSQSNPFFSKLASIFSGNQNNGNINPISIISTGSSAVLGAYQGVQSYKQSMAQGDYMGAGANGWGTAGSVISSLAMPAMMINPLLGAGVMVAGAIANGISAKKQTDKVYHDIAFSEWENYQNMLNYFGTEEAGSLTKTMNNDIEMPYHQVGDSFAPGSGGLYEKSYVSQFGGTDITQDVNSKRAENLWNRVLQKNDNGYLTDNEFRSLVLQQRRNGVNSLEGAGDIASQIGRYSYGTGVSADLIASSMGVITRYGGGNAGSLDSIYKSAMASGLDRSQFDEFLQGISQSMQEGISKGFVNSADKIAENLVTISQIGQATDNASTWVGSQGVAKANMVSNAMSGATNLANTNDMIMYQSAKQFLEKSGKSASVTDVMKFLEKGNFGDGFLQLFDSNLNKYFGGDELSKVLAYKAITGSYNMAGDMMAGIGNVGTVDYNSVNGLEIAETALLAENKVQNATQRNSINKGMQNSMSDILKGGAGLFNLVNNLADGNTYNTFSISTARDYLRANEEAFSNVGLFNSPEFTTAFNHINNLNLDKSERIDADSLTTESLQILQKYIGGTEDKKIQKDDIVDAIVTALGTAQITLTETR